MKTKTSLNILSMKREWQRQNYIRQANVWLGYMVVIF